MLMQAVISDEVTALWHLYLLATVSMVTTGIYTITPQSYPPWYNTVAINSQHNAEIYNFFN